MTTVKFEDNYFELVEDETVLDSLLRHCVEVNYSCKAGLCHTCMLQATSSDLPSVSQVGLSDRQKDDGWFLPCKCIPSNNIVIKGQPKKHKLKLINKCLLNSNTIRLRLEKGTLLYNPGQFVSVTSACDQITRSYSIASTKSDPYLEFHISVIPDGRMSQYLNRLKVGETLELADASGMCYYSNSFADYNLLMAATGTGLAPLYAIIRDALENGHKPDITLYHASATVEGLYYQYILEELAKKHHNFYYYPVVRDKSASDHYLKGELVKTILVHKKDFNNYAAFLCGNPCMIKALKMKLYLSGVDLKNIFSDPFVLSKD